LVSQNVPAAGETTQPTTAPTPTFPPPVTNFDTVSFAEYYLHPSGMYALPQPTGFAISEPASQRGLAQVNMVNNAQLAVIDAFIEDAGLPPGTTLTVDDLSGRFTPDVLAASWSRFQRYTETARRVEGDYLLIDFEVTLNRQIFIARQKVRTDGDWIYVVRVLTPANAADYLRFLVDRMAESFVPFKQFAGMPFEWQSLYNPDSGVIIRYPDTWTITDNAINRSTSIDGSANEALRVELRPGAAVADAAAAQAVILAERPNATLLTTEPVTRGDLSGFAVSYAYTNADGDPFSGYAVLLNTAAGDLNLANLRFPGDAIDLTAIRAADVLAQRQAALTVAVPVGEATQAAEATAEPVDPERERLIAAYGDYVLILYSFSPLPPLNLSAASLPPTPTPIPTAASTQAVEATEAAETTPEVAPEATAEVTPETTVEPTATASSTPTNTATATATASNTPTNTATATATASSTPTNTATATATASNTPTNTATPSNTPTNTATATATATAAPSNTPTNTATATPSSTPTNTATATATATATPSNTPTPRP
jgi:hypothetical protein